MGKIHAGPAPGQIDNLAQLKQTLALDILQFALDIGGMLEPTPFCDAASALISVARGDWLGAGISAVGMIPYIGDLAKTGKIARYVESFSKAIRLAEQDAAFARLLEPALRKLSEVLHKLPLESLPEMAALQIRWVLTKIDNFIKVWSNANRVFKAFAHFPRMSGWPIKRVRQWLAQNGFEVVKGPRLDALGKTDSFGGSEIWFRRHKYPDGSPGPTEAVRIDARGHQVNPSIPREQYYPHARTNVPVAAGEPRHMHKELIDRADEAAYMAGGIRKNGRYWQPPSYNDAGVCSTGKHAETHIWLVP